MKRIFQIVAGSISILLVYSAITGQITQTRLQKAEEHWQQLLDAEIPIGTSKEKIKEWSKKRTISEYWKYFPSKNLFYANVDQVPDAGIGFPCSDWNIIIKIDIDNNGKSVKRDVSFVGTCI